jgi:hypothetical protein
MLRGSFWLKETEMTPGLYGEVGIQAQQIRKTGVLTAMIDDLSKILNLAGTNAGRIDNAIDRLRGPVPPMPEADSARGKESSPSCMAQLSEKLQEAQKLSAFLGRIADRLEELT